MRIQFHISFLLGLGSCLHWESNFFIYFLFSLCCVQSAKPSSIQPLIAEPEIPKEAPPEWEYLVDPPSISGIEL